MEAPYSLFAGTLVVAAGSALWGAVLSRQRRGAPGSGPLMWLMLAIAHWCLTSALHTVTPEMAVRVFWAKVQYLAIPSVPPLWLLFALDYGQWRGVSGDRLALLWAIPLLTLAMAWTNEWHGWLWSSITPASEAPGGRLVYTAMAPGSGSWSSTAICSCCRARWYWGGHSLVIPHPFATSPWRCWSAPRFPGWVTRSIWPA